MKEWALFLGCNIPARLQRYESSSRAVLDELEARLVDLEGFNCCGYPLRNIDFKAYLLSSARNLALAENKGLNIMTLCQCCFGSLKKADSLLKERPSLRQEINGTLEKERLRYDGKIEVQHLLSVLYHEVGIASIQKKLGRTYRGLRVATHYGCHALRPSQVVGFDNPVTPSLFDRLVEATGAESIDWPMKLECCGAPLWGTNDELSMDLTQKKLKDGKQSGADYLCVACPWCQIQFDTVQKQIMTKRGFDPPLPSLLYPQLLGLSMGIDESFLGLRMNAVPINGIEKWFTEKEETSVKGEEAPSKKEEAPAKRGKPINRPKESTVKDT